MGILELKSVTKRFGGLTAVQDLSFSLHPGELMGLIGPNGSGKTTIFNLITGTLSVTTGKIILKDREITRMPSYQICGLGIGRTFQSPRLFSNMTALENIMVGFHPITRSEFISSGLRLPGWRNEERKMVEEAGEMLRFMDIDFIDCEEMATNLPYGHQRLIEIGRVLVAKPKVLLLDEPAAGLNEHETNELGKILKKIRATKVSIILVEHNMDLLMEVSERVVVINYGQKIAEGSPSEIQKDESVIQAYLG